MLSEGQGARLLLAALPAIEKLLYGAVRTSADVAQRLWFSVRAGRQGSSGVMPENTGDPVGLCVVILFPV